MLSLKLLFQLNLQWRGLMLEGRARFLARKSASLPESYDRARKHPRGKLVTILLAYQRFTNKLTIVDIGHVLYCRYLAPPTGSYKMKIMLGIVDKLRIQMKCKQTREE